MVLALVAVAGCAGIEPYEVRNHREEGPERGLFTGPQGEFVIFSHTGLPKSSQEAEGQDAKGQDAKDEAPVD